MPAIHASITRDRVEAALDDYYAGRDNPGFCVKCGTQSDACEPDAEGYECEACHAFAVAGAEILYITMIDTTEAQP